MNLGLTSYPYVIHLVVEKGMVMQNVDLPTSQHRHHNGSRNADRSQDVNRSPRFGGGIVTPI